MNKYAGFDLEIYHEFSEGRPYGISCAGVKLSDKPAAKIFVPLDKSRPMTKVECIRFVDYLEDLAEDGYKIATWNGLQFDFDVLAEESGQKDRCATLAMEHIDMMYQFLCIKGFPVALDRVCQAMNVAGKLDGMSGAAAPALWQQGEYDLVSKYLAQDCIMTVDVAEAVEKYKGFKWVTGKGMLAEAKTRDFKLLSVKECESIPLPDIGWMDKPITRASMMKWISQPEPAVPLQVPSGTVFERVTGSMLSALKVGGPIIVPIEGDGYYADLVIDTTQLPVVISLSNNSSGITVSIGPNSSGDEVAIVVHNQGEYMFSETLGLTQRYPF